MNQNKKKKVIEEYIFKFSFKSLHLFQIKTKNNWRDAKECKP